MAVSRFPQALAEWHSNGSGWGVRQGQHLCSRRRVHVVASLIAADEVGRVPVPLPVVFRKKLTD